MLSNLRIRTRMLLSYAIIIVLTLIACTTAIVMLQNVGGSLTEFYEKQFQTVDSTWAARRAVYASRSEMLQAIIETDAGKTKEYLDSASEEIKVVEASLERTRASFQGDTSLVDQAESLLKQAEPIREKMFRLIEASDVPGAFAIMNKEYIPLTDDLRATLTEVGSQADTNAKQRVEDGQQLASTATIIVIIIAAISVLFAILLGVVISNGIRRPVAEIEAAARDLSNGKLSTDILYRSRDELGNLADSMRDTTQGLSAIISDVSYLLNGIAQGDFNIRTQNEEGYKGDFRPMLTAIKDMNSNLSDTMRQISQAADQVSGGSDQVSSGAQALSQGATEQASSVEELAATINDISQQVGISAENASGASQRATSIGDEIRESNQQMQQMTAAMAEISGSSNEIGKIIKTIEDIAFQTNILALNAAVEAARAGAAGKGFAVVADEVRNLASKSAEASKNTAALIENSIKSVEHGTRIAGETAEKLVVVVKGAEDIVVSIDEIANSSKNQAEAISQVTQGVDQISSVVQTNSATAEESAAASEELSGQAQLLKSLVSRFKLMSTGDGQMYGNVPQAPAADYHYSAPQMERTYDYSGMNGNTDKY